MNGWFFTILLFPGEKVLMANTFNKYVLKAMYVVRIITNFIIWTLKFTMIIWNKEDYIIYNQILLYSPNATSVWIFS